MTKKSQRKVFAMRVDLSKLLEKRDQAKTKSMKNYLNLQNLPDSSSKLSSSPLSTESPPNGKYFSACCFGMTRRLSFPTSLGVSGFSNSTSLSSSEGTPGSSPCPPSMTCSSRSSSSSRFRLKLRVVALWPWWKVQGAVENWWWCGLEGDEEGMSMKACCWWCWWL